MRGFSSAKTSVGSLNHPVLKVERTFHLHISRFLLPVPDRKQQACNQLLHVGRRHKSEQELSRNMRGKSSIYAIEMRPRWLHKTGV